MKNTRAVVMILLSLIAGAVAVWLAARWVGLQTHENTTSIVSASRDLDPGVVLQLDMLHLVPWPKGSVPNGPFSDPKKLVGRVLAERTLKGEALLEQNMAPVGSSGGMSASIPQGKRAISIQVNEIVGVAGYIHPGSKVDVLVNMRENNDKAVSKIVLEKILVLAVAQDDRRDQAKPKVVSTVTLEVDPQQAEKIDLARNIGTLSLTLRNPLDSNTASTQGARREDLMGLAPPKPVAVATPAAAPASAAAPKPISRAPRSTTPEATVEVIRGVQKANTAF